MPLMQLGFDTFNRERGNMPSIENENMFAEAVPVEETGVILQSRPPLADREADMGTGPIRALFQRDGVLDGDLFGVSAGDLYRETTSVGALGGSGHVSIAGNEIGVMATAGTALRYYEGTTLANVAIPDSAQIVKVMTAGARFVAIRKNTGVFYWTEPLEATFDSLSFATAEAAPDGLLDGLYGEGMLTLFGRETTEFWQNNPSDPDLPFIPLPGRVYPVGIKNTGAACQYANSFAWVGDDNVVYMPAQTPARISNAGLEEKIAASAYAYLFAFRLEGTEFLALRVDAGTWVRSATTGLWSKFTSAGQDNWLPRCWANNVFGSAVDGRTFAFGTGHADLGGELTRKFRAGFPLNGGSVKVNNIGLRTDPGNTPYVSGSFADPTIEMRLSRDAGRTWGAWKPKSLGVQGEYRKRIQWRGLGDASQPGLLCEWRLTDPVPLRVSAALINEPRGGR